MIDNFDAVESDLKRQVAANYSLRPSEDIDLNFLLTDLSLGDLQTMDSGGGVVVGASLAFPSIECISHQTDINNGRWRKIYDLDKPMAYTLGNKHSFIHPLKHDTVSREYQLITSASRTLEPILYPDSQIVGNKTSPITYIVRNDQSLEVKPTGPILLHGHTITNETAYDNCEKRPFVSEILRSVPGESVVADYHTHCPIGSYQHLWFHKQPELQNEKGCMVHLDDYSKACYDFLQQVNTNRSTNFGHSGLWWNAQVLRDVPCLKFTMKFRIVSP